MWNYKASEAAVEAMLNGRRNALGAHQQLEDAVAVELKAGHLQGPTADVTDVTVTVPEPVAQPVPVAEPVVEAAVVIGVDITKVGEGPFLVQASGGWQKTYRVVQIVDKGGARKTRFEADSVAQATAVAAALNAYHVSQKS